MGYRCKNCGNTKLFKTNVTIKTEIEVNYDEDGAIVEYDDGRIFDNLDFDKPFECVDCGSTEIEGVEEPPSEIEGETRLP